MFREHVWSVRLILSRYWFYILNLPVKLEGTQVPNDPIHLPIIHDPAPYPIVGIQNNIPLNYVSSRPEKIKYDQFNQRFL